MELFPLFFFVDLAWRVRHGSPMSTDTDYRYIFGPVPSRRLGRSLGVDLSPLKTCTLDCVFCQLGRGPSRGAERFEAVPVGEVFEELAHWLKHDGQADWVTLSGSGEPTLHSRFGEVIDFVRERTELPVALLSNGTLFGQADVRQSAARAQLVKISLSAWDQHSFEAINRPHPEISFDGVMEGYHAFREQYRGTLWIEVFLIPGMNDRPDDVSRIAALAREIRPDSVQLNTAVRPPAEGFVQPLAAGALHEMAALFDPPAEVIASFRGSGGNPRAPRSASILALLKRHPAPAEDIASMLACPVADILPTLQALEAAGRVWTDERDAARHYRVTPTDS